MIEQIQGERIAVDAAGYATFVALQGVKPMLRLEDPVSRLRYIKNDAEIELTGLAAGYADHGLAVARQAIADGLASGITELDVVREVKAQTTAKMRRELEDLVNFYRSAVTLTVHTGPRAALPHGQPGPVALSPGDTVIVGIGVK